MTRAKLPSSEEACKNQQRLVALLGIAQRSISIKYAQKSRNRNQAKALSVNIKTIAEWIKVKRMEKNLTPGHLAAKMGIAMALVRSWESGGSQPDRKQLQGLANYLGLLCERHQEAQLIGRRP